MNLIESLMDNYEDKSLALGDGVLPYIDGHTRILDAPLRRLPEKSRTIENSCMLFAGKDGTYDQISAKGFSAENQNIISNSNGEFVRSHNHVNGRVTSACLFNPKSSFVEETGPKHISFLVNSDATLMDLNLGRSSDSGNSKKSKSIDDNGTSSSSTSPVVAKRTRTTILNSQTAFCQVYGCNMDLSSFKEYYRRHRVCQTHSKAANVIVNDMEQRFCQQCSRFHLLNEFDDGKRSCRKRLAGHNARRRKPQISVISGRMGRVTQPYPGLNFLETTSLDNRSFLSPSIFSYSAGRDARFENMFRHPTPAFDRQLPQTFQIPSCVDKKQFAFISSMDARTMRTNLQYNSDYDPSFATSSFTISSSEISESACAHSLLSSQDQNMKRVGRSYFENTTAMPSQALNNLNPSNYNLSRIKHMQNAHLGVLTLDARNAVDFQSSRFIGANEHVCHENSQTVDLLQFPSALLNGEEHKLTVRPSEGQI